MVQRFTWFIALLATTGSAASLDEPVVWRDTDTGCAYLLTPQGGIALRYRRNGMPDCPDASASGVIDDTARGLARGLDALRREVERLGEGYGQRR
jgi:hypothetical protein